MFLKVISSSGQNSRYKIKELKVMEWRGIHNFIAPHDDNKAFNLLITDTF